MTYKSKRLAHARHNEAVSNKLHDAGGFGDWVITTAFYAALHFVKAKLFPLQYVHPQDGAQVYPTFESFYGTGLILKGKHDTLYCLVKKQCPQIAPEYRQLLDTCLTSRYFDYEQCPEMVKRSRKSFKVIKAYCHR